MANEHETQAKQGREGIPWTPGEEEKSERFEIKMKPVISSNIKRTGYHEELQILQIEFQHGGVYQFFNVPLSVIRDMEKAESVGKFFHARIKNKFAGDKLGAQPDAKEDPSRIEVTVSKVEKEYTISIPRTSNPKTPATKEEILAAQQEALLIVQRAGDALQGRPPSRQLLAVS